LNIGTYRAKRWHTLCKGWKVYRVDCTDSIVKQVNGEYTVDLGNKQFFKVIHEKLDKRTVGVHFECNVKINKNCRSLVSYFHVRSPARLYTHPLETTGSHQALLRYYSFCYYRYEVWTSEKLRKKLAYVMRYELLVGR